MPRDHARTNLDIWGDDEWMDLSAPAQHLYFVLWTSPQLSYCGAGEWHPGRLASRSRGQSVAAVEEAGAELSRALFLIIEPDTSEFLLRSWIKHDGLWRIPNMAVSMANARADLASRTLRGVIVHEVKKLVAANPDLSSWQRDAVVNLLSQKAIDPATLEPFNPGPNGGVNPTANPRVNPPSKGWDGVNPNPASNPPANPGPTPSPTPAPFTPAPLGGYVSAEGHQGATAVPAPHCPKHPGGTDRPCAACGDARRAHAAAVKQIQADELTERRRRRQVAANCPICHGTNWIPDTEPAVKCNHQETRHA
jgi:hypothetical protein